MSLIAAVGIAIICGGACWAIINQQRQILRLRGLLRSQQEETQQLSRSSPEGPAR